MSNASPHTAPRRLSRRTIAYGLAVVLPVAASYITAHLQTLYPYPQALTFLVTALVASLEGLGPALVSVVFAILARAWQVNQGPHPPFDLHSDAIRYFILLIAAVIISMTVERRRASEARLESAVDELSERTDALIESLNGSKCASWLLDMDTDNITRWYSGSYPIFGRPFNEVTTFRALRDLFHPDDQQKLFSLANHFQTSTEPIGFEHRVLWPDGAVHWLEMRATRIEGPGRRWRGLTFDITERKQTEEALLRSEKLAAMGRLASTVAHEINNPLEAVTNLLYLAHDDDALSETTRGYIETAEKELARLGNITRLTLGFVRTSANPTEIDLAAVIEDVLALLQHRFDMKAIRLERDFEPAVRILIPPHELRQIATNLIANAADAVSGPDAAISVRIAREHDRAVLSVLDNGAGIPQANLQRIFDPFFTTKNEVGTGIGLWVTKEIVEKNNGHIAVESGNLANDYRTAFRVDFPLA